MINFRCPKCGDFLSVPESLAGSTEECPGCGNVATVPRSATLAIGFLIGQWFRKITNADRPTEFWTSAADGTSPTLTPSSSSGHPKSGWPSLDFRWPGERASLYVGLGITAVLLLVLVGVSWGLILIVVGIAVVYVKVMQGQLLGNSVRVNQEQLPQVYELAITAASRLGITIP